MSSRPLLAFVVTLLTVGPLAGCSSEKRSIRVPASALAQGEPDARPVARPYVIKMSDGRRTWQIEIPAGAAAPAFEAAIPLELGAPVEPAPDRPATEADRELLDAKRARGESVPEAGSTAEGPPSYLRTLAVVRDLYRRKQFELALIELVRLERVFPDDVRILEMKGTLLSRLGRIAEARAAWERVLALDPDNTVVVEALEGLPATGG